MIEDDFETRVFRIIGDRQGLSTQELDVTNWTNDGLREINRRTKYHKATDTFDTVADTEGYNVPSDFVAVDSLLIDGSPIAPLTRQQYQHKYTTQARGIPNCYWTDHVKFYLAPIPDQVKTVTVHYTRKPIVYTSHAVNHVDLPDQLLEPLFQFVLARAYDFRGNLAQSNYHYMRYEGMMSEIIEDADHIPEESYPSIRLLEEDSWYR